MVGEITLVMLCAGSGARFSQRVKKQWVRIGDRPLWVVALDNLMRATAGALNEAAGGLAEPVTGFKIADIIVVCDDPNFYERFSSSDKIRFIKGGKTRQESLLNAINETKTPLILTSDAARVMVSKSVVKRLFEGILQSDCVVPVLSVADTAIYNDDYINRDGLKLVQTPQLSKTATLGAALKAALSSDKIFSDDSSMVAANGGTVGCVEGDERARKVTVLADLEALKLRGPAADFFSGVGYDSHAFCEGDAIILGGVRIAYNRGLKAHSDGDAAAHAVVDAILGAAGLGDIGEHFSDTDEAYRGADSMLLLKEAARRVRAVGYEIVNIDAQIIAQAPKLSPYKLQMAKNIAKNAGIAAHRVSIKATTNEKMGFVGRGEGIAVIASASLKYIDWRGLGGFDAAFNAADSGADGGDFNAPSNASAFDASAFNAADFAPSDSAKNAILGGGR